MIEPHHRSHHARVVHCFQSVKKRRIEKERDQKGSPSYIEVEKEVERHVHVDPIEKP